MADLQKLVDELSSLTVLEAAELSRRSGRPVLLDEIRLGDRANGSSRWPSVHPAGPWSPESQPARPAAAPTQLLLGTRQKAD